MDFNFMHSILDEVALEGLDGITLPSLWVRLENRPKFPIKIDNDSKAFIWKSIAIHNEVEIFELPEPRPVVQIYNRYEHVDDLGLVLDEPADLVDIYPVVMVSDKKGIRGSSSTYHSRKNITSLIRDEDSLLLTLNEVYERWGDKLVLVASARARLHSLIGPTVSPLIEMNLEEYCLLERLGRGRYLGEVTQGQKGLLKMNAPFSKQLHYYGKKLGMYGLIMKQKHFSRSSKGIATSGTLLHLSRFYVQRSNKMELLMELMCDILKDKPSQMESCVKLKQEMNISYATFKKLINSRNVVRWLEVVTVPSSELRQAGPSGAPDSSSDKIVKAVKLIKHCREDSLDDDKEECLPANIHFDASKAFVNYPILLQAYRLIQEAGPQGLSIVELANKLTISKLDSRMLLKILKRQKLIVDFLHEVGRQKVNRFIAATLGDQNEDYTSFRKGQDKTDCAEISISLKRKNINSAGPSTSKRCRLNEDVVEIKSEDTSQENKTDEIPSDVIAFNQIETDIFELENFEDFSGKLSKVQSVNDVSTSAEALHNPIRMTLRKMKRTHMVVEYLHKNKFTNVIDLMKFIKDLEKNEGYVFKMDRKSVLRLLHWLFMLKKVKIIKAVMKLGSRKTEVELICDPSLKADDPVIKPVIDEAKLRLYSAVKDKDSSVSADKFSLNDKKDDETDVASRKIDLTPNQVQMLQNFKNVRKFARYKIFHMFLYYLVHGYEGCAAEASKEPVVYHQSMTWKRFIPPLPKDSREGWCFVGDVIKYLPLYVFVYSINMWEKICEFADYLFDDEQCYYLITQLPKRMLNVVLHRRQYLFRIDEILRNLCYMGLVSFGPQTSKVKSHTHVYVHKVAKFKDTSKSPVRYMYIDPDVQYEEREFVFNTMADVEKYWIELEKVCSETRLSSFNSAIGQTFEIAGPSIKPELIEAVRHKDFDEVSDIGFVPGDGRGAAGLDSSLYAHYGYNWRRKVSKIPDSKVPRSSPNPTSYMSMKDLLKKNRELMPNRLKRLNRLREAALRDKCSSENKIPNVESTVSKPDCSPQSAKPSKLGKRKKVILRTVKKRQKKKERAPYMDEKDMAALKKMSLTRVRAEWSAQEDSFLLLCKVASAFLDHPTKGFVVPYTIVRDLLHEHCPEEGSTKTSRACQRRIHYMMMNPTTMKNVSVFLGEAKQDPQLLQDFPRPAKSTDEAAWADAFTGLVKRLVYKFSMPASDRCKVLSLPDSKELFEKHFTVITPDFDFQRRNKYNDPCDEMDVKQCIMRSLIFSVMAVEKDPKWTYLLHKLHQNNQYAFDTVVSSIKNEKVLATTSKGCKRDTNLKLMASLPYRFSIVYENNLLTKFPSKLLVESKGLLDKFKASKKEVVRLKDDIPSGYTVAVTALVMLNEIDLTLNIPDHIILFDSGLSKETRSSIVERMMQTLSDKESSELASMLNEDKRCPLDEEELAYESSSKTEALSSLSETQHSKNASRFALYLLRQELNQPIVERTQHSQDYIVLNSCEILCHLKKSSSLLENGFKQDSCTVESNTREQKRKILTDGCVSEIKASILSFIPPGAFDLYQNFNEPLEMIYDIYSAQTLKDAKDIFEAIENAGPVGISEKSIWKKFATLDGELSLFEHLHLFREAMLIIRAGIASFVYVSISFAKLWTLQSYVLPKICYGATAKNKTSNRSSLETPGSRSGAQSSRRVGTVRDSKAREFGGSDSSNKSSRLSASQVPEVVFSEEVYFLPRTWRCPDGSLNKKVLFQLLRTVLSYIIHYPSVSSSRVMERFSLNLQPVQTLELLEVLERSCCIAKYFSRKPKKGGLFSPLTPVVITENPHPDDIDHLEPLPDAICNLSKIEDAFV